MISARRSRSLFRVPLILLNKPFRVLSQFTDPEKQTLADYVDAPGVYPAGRLDYDSEGLLLLTDDGRLQARISQPRSGVAKVYRVQVEGRPDAARLARLERGVHLKDGTARAIGAREIDEPEGLWPRNPPIRVRKSVPDTWLEIGVREGRNRMIRRMTAAVGLPTLRLIRWQIGPWTLDGLHSGETRVVDTRDAWRAIDR